jgi:hypothetical protein
VTDVGSRIHRSPDQPRTIAVVVAPSPAVRWRWVIRAGLAPALVMALVLTVVQFELSRKCRGGAFSSGFSNGLDRPYCDLVIRKLGSDFQFKVQLPY